MIILQNFVEAVGLKRFIITDRLNFGELQVDDISAKISYGRKYEEIYQLGKSSFK